MSEFKSALEDEGYYIERTTKKIDDNWVSGRWVIGIDLKIINNSCDSYDNYDTKLSSELISETEVKLVAQKSQKSQTKKKELLQQVYEFKSQYTNLVLIEDIKSLSPAITDEIIEKAIESGDYFEPKPGYIQKVM